MKIALKTLALTSVTSTFLAFCATNALAAPQKAKVIPATTTVDVELKGYLFGFKVMRANYRSAYTDTKYHAEAELKTSGLGAFLKKFKIWSMTEGVFDGAELRPRVHVQQNMDKKNRRVEMVYTKGILKSHIVPRLGSLGLPPASPRQRFESDDSLSALMNIMMRGYRTSAEPCSGKVPVFDSKQHYNLRMQKAGTRRVKQKGYKGDTIVCHVFYEPVSGFDPEDLPNAEEVSAPIVMYMAKFEQANLYIPVRMTYKISGFKAVIKARNITVRTQTNVPVQRMRKLAVITNPFAEAP